MLTVYTKPNCNKCSNLKAKMLRLQVPHTLLVIGQDVTREDFLDKYPEAKSVPFVLEGEKVIENPHEYIEENFQNMQ